MLTDSNREPQSKEVIEERMERKRGKGRPRSHTDQIKEIIDVGLYQEL